MCISLRAEVVPAVDISTCFLLWLRVKIIYSFHSFWDRNCSFYTLRGKLQNWSPKQSSRSLCSPEEKVVDIISGVQYYYRLRAKRNKFIFIVVRLLSVGEHREHSITAPTAWLRAPTPLYLVIWFGGESSLTWKQCTVHFIFSVQFRTVQNYSVLSYPLLK